MVFKTQDRRQGSTGILESRKPWRGAPMAHSVQSFQAKVQGPQVVPGELPELRSQILESGDTKMDGLVQQSTGEERAGWRETLENHGGSPGVFS